jgi:ZIP family zinc transporter
MPTGKDNVAVAFALTIGAGAATALGASVVFFPSLVKYANRKTLAAALGLSAGVMIYLSFVAIFHKSKSSFEDARFSEEDAYKYATACFLGGVVLTIVLNHMVTLLLQGEHPHPEPPATNHNTTTTEPMESSFCEEANHNYTSNDTTTTNNDKYNDNKDDKAIAPCICYSEDPAKDLERLQTMAKEIETTEQDGQHQWEGQKAQGKNDGHGHVHHAEVDGDVEDDDEESSKVNEVFAEAAALNAAEEKKLLLMSINTAIAMGLHNFPEGLATFVATLADPKVGAVLAVATAIHNIPEGLCVALPIYYATGNRWKAFGWAVLSGVSEPFAALLGWAVLANSFSNQLYAVLFGFVAGMMVVISVRELLPTAHRYDPEDTVVTYSFIGGMGIIALSLVLFVL